MSLPSICPPHTEPHLFGSIEEKEIRTRLDKAEKPVCNYNTKIQQIYGNWQFKKKKKSGLLSTFCMQSGGPFGLCDTGQVFYLKTRKFTTDH